MDINGSDESILPDQFVLHCMGRALDAIFIIISGML